MNIGLLLSLLFGWFVGGLGNWLADQVPDAPQTPIRFHLRPTAPPTLGAAAHIWTLPWFWRRTTCPHCDRARPWRAPLLELTMLTAFGYTWVRYAGQPWSIGLIWLYATLLLTIAAIDFEHRRVPNRLVVPGALIVLACNLLPNTPGLPNALIGGAIGFFGFLLIYIVGRGSMGMGDVKLAGLIGLMTGYPAIWTALVTGIILGGVSALLLLLTRRGTLKTYIAYGPYLALGALLALWQRWSV